MSQLVDDLKNLKNIILEEKRVNTELKLIRIDRKIIETRIADYLHNENKPGIKYQDLVILSKSRKTTKRLKAKQKDDNVVNVLENMGLTEPEKAWTTIKQAMKGEEITVDTIQVKEKKERNDNVLVV